MVRILFPDPADGKPLVFFLAAEEFLARHSAEDCLLLWRVPPTVIVGRNQDMESEADISFCRDNGISIYRRKSGGGCVYADSGNLMVSAVVGGTDRMFVFSRFISQLALCLRKAGFDAWPSGRNDITVDGRKVSGSAFYSTGFRNIIHATLLCNVDLDMMQHALTPPPGKLSSKGISSVRQRVANLSESGDADMGRIAGMLSGMFCSGERTLTAGDMEQIGRLMESYLDPAFILGRSRIRKKSDSSN